MLDLHALLQSPDLYKNGFQKKGVKIDVDKILALDARRRELIQKTENLRAEQNRASKEIPKAPAETKSKLLAEMNTLKNELKNLAEELEKIETELNAILITAPNLPHASVPAGLTEDENQTVRTVGEPRKFDFPIRNHAELGEITDTIDTKRAVRLSGSRFGYLKNELPLIEFALVSWILEKLFKKNFTPIVPPVLVREEAMQATGFFNTPADRSELYRVNPDEDNLYLTGTSEIPLTMLHAEEFLEEKNLPKRYVGFSTCFRREAGAAGRDSVGIFRVHQFDKIEMYSFCQPEKSCDEHDFILSIEEEILRELDLPYRVLNICGGDLGSPAAKKYDCEAWIPSENRYRELTSTSNCTDFQARRAKVKFKTASGEKKFVHTLNGTASAIGRTLIAIMENYQNADGSITVPEVLRKYVGFEKISCK